MPNPKIEKLIADALRTGLVHPGDPANNLPPKPIALPFGHTAGRPQQMNDLMDATVKLIAEAVVALIESEGEIVSHDELASMRVAGGEMPEAGSTVEVHCRCDTPLLTLTMTAPQRAVVDGAALLRGLNRRAVACPHERVSDE